MKTNASETRKEKGMGTKKQTTRQPKINPRDLVKLDRNIGELERGLAWAMNPESGIDSADRNAMRMNIRWQKKILDACRGRRFKEADRLIMKAESWIYCALPIRLVRNVTDSHFWS